jgi:iron-sulfur cluster repair protein YtfE (RIC family)
VAHLVEMVTMLHHHHAGEDELVWPRLEQRAELSDDLVARMEEQHAQVSVLLDAVDALLPPASPPRPRWSCARSWLTR